MRERVTTEHDCDETCSCCPICYLASRLEICSRLCEHAEPEDADETGEAA